MSTTIECAKQVFYVGKEGQKNYILLVRVGDSSLRDDKGMYRRSWNFVFNGTEGELWKEIGSRLGSVAGGSIQRPKGWNDYQWYEIEDYIKQYRSKIKCAKPLEKLLENFSITAIIRLKEDFKSEEDKKQESLLKYFISKYEMKTYGCCWYEKDKSEYTHHISDCNTLADFLLNLPHGSKKDYTVTYEITKR